MYFDAPNHLNAPNTKNIFLGRFLEKKFFITIASNKNFFITRTPKVHH